MNIGDLVVIISASEDEDDSKIFREQIKEDKLKLVGQIGDIQSIFEGKTSSGHIIKVKDYYFKPEELQLASVSP